MGLFIGVQLFPMIVAQFIQNCQPGNSNFQCLAFDPAPRVKLYFASNMMLLVLRLLAFSRSGMTADEIRGSRPTDEIIRAASSETWGESGLWEGCSTALAASLQPGR